MSGDSLNSPVANLRNFIFSYLITPGFVLFLIFYIYLFVLNQNRGYEYYDDFDHWGPMVKEMLRIGNLYDVPESLEVVHRDYPPIVQLLRYLFCTLGGGYSESLCFMTQQVLVYSFFISCFNSVWKNFKLIRSIIFIGISLLTPLFSGADPAGIIISVQIDVPMAIITGYLIYSVSKSEWIPPDQIPPDSEKTSRSIDNDHQSNNLLNSK
jgi:hypothetical protein